jgi:hypothetical protein
MRRPYTTESAIAPGTAVVQGSKEHTVKSPGANGSGDFIGIYAYEANEAKEASDSVGIALAGTVKVLAGGVVSAGKKAVIKDATGALVVAPTTAGQYATCGTFLENGTEGEYVDFLVEHGSVTVPSAE